MFDNTSPIAFLIQNQFPELYREKGPQLIAFTTAFFAWMEEPDNAIWFSRRLLQLRDIDSTINEFVVFFKEKYLNDIQYNINSNVKLFVKNSLPFYRSKGSPRSIELFFQLIYGQDAVVYYPRDNIFKLSDGQWVVPTYLEITDSPVNVTYINQQIQGVYSNATAFVDRYVKKKVGAKSVDIFFIDNLNGNFQTGEQIFLSSAPDLTDAPFITGSLSNVAILIGGEEFSVGDAVNFINPEGIVEGNGIIASTESITGVVDIALIDGGWGFTANATTLLSEYVLFLSNVVVQNTALSNSFLYFETLNQPVANISFNALTGGSFTVGEVLATYYANGSSAGTANILSVNQNVASNTGVASIAMTTGNLDLGLTTLFLPGNTGASANLLTFTDETVVANVIGISTNATLYLSNSHGTWSNGIAAFQPGINGANGYVNQLSVFGTNTTLFMTNVTGVFTNTSVFGKTFSNTTVANGTLVSFDTTIGVANVDGNYTNAAFNIVRGLVSNTTATLNVTSTGAGASFAIGGLTQTENITQFEEIINGNNVFGIPYLQLDFNTAEYGFIRNHFANANTIILQALTPISETIGTITSLTAINPGEGYNVTPFVLVIQPDVAYENYLDYIISINPIAGNFVPGEEIIETLNLANSVILTVNNATAPVYLFIVNAGGTGYVNGNLLIAQSAVSTTNAVANVTTNATGGIVSFSITNFGNGFVTGTNPIVSVTNSTGGATGIGTGASLSANITYFIPGEPVYSVNSSTNVATATLQFETANSLNVNTVTGTFSLSNNVIGAISNAQANVTNINITGYSINAVGIVKSTSNASVLNVRRISIGQDFISNGIVSGLASGATANIVSVSDDTADHQAGWNANVTANVTTSEGSVTSITVTDSGYGYVNSDVITFVSLDGVREGTAQALVFQQGTGAGYYRSTNGFLSSDQHLQDGSYYQLFSYEIQTPIPFATYEAIFRKVLHSAGMALFGAVYTTTELSIDAGVSTNTFETVNLTVIGEANDFFAFTPGDILVQGNTTGGLIDYAHAEIVIPSNAVYYEAWTTIYQPNALSANAMGTLVDIVVNATANTARLYLANISGTFVNTSNIQGISSRSFNYTLIQQLEVVNIANSDLTTQSFTIGENVYQTNSSSNTAVGVVVGANSGWVSVTVSSGTFANSTLIKGATSSAKGTVINLTPASFTVGNEVAEIITVANLQLVTSYNGNTGSFTVGETVIQQQKNYASPNATIANTMIAQVVAANSSSVTLQKVFGFVANNTALLGTVTTTDIISVNSVVGTFLPGEPIWQSNGSVVTANGILQSANITITFGTLTVGNVAGTFSNVFPIFGVISEATATINSIANGHAQAYINGVETVNSVTGNISLVNSTVINITNVVQNQDVAEPASFAPGYFIVSSAGAVANLTVQLADVLTNTGVNSAINIIKVEQVFGQFVVTSNSSTTITDLPTANNYSMLTEDGVFILTEDDIDNLLNEDFANTGATANITGITVFD